MYQSYSFKSALVTPILKKRCLDHNDLNNYRPVSNLCFIAKICLIPSCLSYINSHNLYNTCQSAYRPGHSTETALLKVVNDLFLSLNKGNISVLALLDFSSAFDTIDHTILVHRLHTDFGFTDTVLQWFSSYLTDRTHYVSLCNQVSSYINSHNLYNTCQSAYRPGHSTETALLKVVNDLFLSLNKGNISVLALLDFSSAFDTIDHGI